MAIRDCGPRGLDGPALWKIDFELFASQGLTIPGEETDPDAHGRRRGLEAVRLPAAAARLHIRILDREAGAHHAVVHEVDLAAAEVRQAVRIDVDLDALGIDHVVVRRGLLFPAELVRHPGAAAAHHTDPETPLGLAFLETELRHLLRGHFSHRNHAILPIWRAFPELTLGVIVSQDATQGAAQVAPIYHRMPPAGRR